MNTGKNKMSKRRTVFWYLLFGPLIGLLAVCVGQTILAIYFSVISASGLSLNDLYREVILGILLYLVFGYPFALIIGAIPAVVSGLIIHSNTKEKADFLYAGFIGFVVSFLFYGLLVMSLYGSYLLLLYLALVGAIAAATTRKVIHRIEIKASLSNGY